MRIQDRQIGCKYPPLIIAEIGINHEGDLQKAKKMVLDAHQSGAECVKFQCHIVDDEMIPEARFVIPGNAEESIYEIMDRCALSLEDEHELKRYSEDLGLIYLNTPFSRAAADRLNTFQLPAYKIGSGECNNLPLIKHICSFGKPIILSTGMNDLNSIKDSVAIIEGAGLDYALLHCTSMYPTPYDKVNLGAISEFIGAFPKAVVGLSDHSIGNYTSFAAVGLGASIIEKHFTSDKSWPGPDVPISIDPRELSDLKKGCEAVYLARGNKKKIHIEEKPTIDFAYASVVSIKSIEKGQKLSEENIWVKRPGTGEIQAKEYENCLNRIALVDIEKDVQIRWSMIGED